MKDLEKRKSVFDTALEIYNSLSEYIKLNMINLQELRRKIQKFKICLKAYLLIYI